MVRIGIGNMITQDKKYLPTKAMRFFTKEKAEQEAREAIKDLSLKEQKILLMRYGFYDGKTWTLEEVSKEYGCTSENIRLIEKKAFDSLHNCSKEYAFLHAANSYTGLRGKVLERYKTAVQCEKCGSWNIPIKGSINACPKCSLLKNHIWLCCQRDYKKRYIINPKEYVILEEKENYFLLRHSCGRTIVYQYDMKAPLKCEHCESLKNTRSRIDLSLFSIKHEYLEYLELQHICGNIIEYPCDSIDPPRCYKCGHPELTSLIENANFSIEKEYPTGFYIRHSCGFRRKYRFDNTTEPICQVCSVQEKKQFKKSLYQKELSLELLPQIDQMTRQQLIEVGIRNTREFFPILFARYLESF